MSFDSPSNFEVLRNPTPRTSDRLIVWFKIVFMPKNMIAILIRFKFSNESKTKIFAPLNFFRFFISIKLIDNNNCL